MPDYSDSLQEKNKKNPLMKRKNLVILLPKIVRTGPILGASAIANTIQEDFDIEVISIKGGFLRM